MKEEDFNKAMQKHDDQIAHLVKARDELEKVLEENVCLAPEMVDDLEDALETIQICIDCSESANRTVRRLFKRGGFDAVHKEATNTIDEILNSGDTRSQLAIMKILLNL